MTVSLRKIRRHSIYWNPHTYAYIRARTIYTTSACTVYHVCCRTEEPLVADRLLGGTHHAHQPRRQPRSLGANNTIHRVSGRMLCISWGLSTLHPSSRVCTRSYICRNPPVSVAAMCQSKMTASMGEAAFCVPDAKRF